MDATFATLHTAGRRPQGKANDDLRSARVVDVEDTTGSLTTWLRPAGAKQGSVLVLRHDKFVFGVSDGRTGELTRALVAQLGLDHPASAVPVAQWAEATR